MSDTKFIQLYAQGGRADRAYFLEDGSVYFFASDADKYALRGRNLIVGASELILAALCDTETGRLETAVADEGARLKSIGAEKFIASLSSYSFAINVCMVIAKQVHLTNDIINKNLAAIDGKAKKARECAVEFYRIIERLRADFDKRRLPALRDVIVAHETSLTYKRGEAFGRAVEQTVVAPNVSLEERYIEYPKDALICEEGTPGDDMFILKSGTVDVYVQGNRVASIGEPGSVFGEIALLLGLARTATMKAKSGVVISRIRKQDLKEISATDGRLLSDIAASLAKKHRHNIDKIASVNAMILERQIDSEAGKSEKAPLDYNRIYNDLLALKRDVTALYESKKADFLQDLVDGF
ncbi:MAG TPA: cyclic nucleotide-binding domain-containing protein [Spirochaetota bacterium]|nr:cyclic nucleotide-binding domain-containing protein [Spirochaetota bacterium]HPI22268.1 cyclic nucleotide-binding domain-containing protein [Spirochaetota bacterium]HPU87870.1 cyclic nucleotide-binding domain-containing protein [Spirochaetota bacterium]